MIPAKLNADKYYNNFSQFLFDFKTCDVVILMDAFMTQRTVKLVEILKPCSGLNEKNIQGNLVIGNTISII